MSLRLDSRIASRAMIDELVSEMRTLVDASADDGDANGYFAAMYLGVTTRSSGVWPPERSRPRIALIR